MQKLSPELSLFFIIVATGRSVSKYCVSVLSSQLLKTACSATETIARILKKILVWQFMYPTSQRVK